MTCLICYALACVELKRSSVEAAARTYFPLAVLALLLAQFALTAAPASNVEGGRRCRLVDAGYARERATGWLYLVVLPYLLPMAACAGPCVRVAMR